MWKKEMEEKDLIDLPGSFFVSTYHKIQHLGELAAEEPDPLQYKIIMDRLYFLLNDLREMRLSKIVSRCLTSQDLPPSEKHLAKQERRFIRTFWGLLKNLREINSEKSPVTEPSDQFERKEIETHSSPEKPPVLSSLPSEDTASMPLKVDKSDIELIILRFLESIDAFVGVDGQNYGPFSTGDVATVPSQNAYKVLIPRGKAEEIEVETNLL